MERVVHVDRWHAANTGARRARARHHFWNALFARIEGALPAIDGGEQLVLDGNHRTGLLLVLDQHCASGVVRGVGCSGTTSQSQLGGTVTAAAVGNHIHATASCEG